MHELRVTAALELHVNATYYTQHPALKSVYEKSQSVIVSKLFTSNRVVFKPAQGLQDSKTSYLSYSYDALVRKKASTYVKMGCLHHFDVLYYHHQF